MEAGAVGGGARLVADDDADDLIGRRVRGDESVHFSISKREGGKKAVENAILAHRLRNRIDYSITDGRSYASDLERIRKAREDAIRRNKQGPDASTRI